MTTPQDVRALADEPLLDALKSVVARANEITTELLVHLGEVDARKLYLGQATSSMHVYCTSRLGLSDAAAFKRIHAARLARRFPIILEWVSSGSLHLSGLAVLGAKLTEDNHRELLAMAAGRSKRDIEQLVASRFPQADVPARIRKLPAAPPKVDRQQLLASAGASRRSQPAPPAPPPAGDVPPRRPAGRTDAVDPLSADRFRVQFTASRGQVDKLRQLQELVSHQVPDGDLAEVIERAVAVPACGHETGNAADSRDGEAGGGGEEHEDAGEGEGGPGIPGEGEGEGEGEPRPPLRCDGQPTHGVAIEVEVDAGEEAPLAGVFVPAIHPTDDGGALVAGGPDPPWRSSPPSRPRASATPPGSAMGPSPCQAPPRRREAGFGGSTGRERRSVARTSAPASVAWT